MSAFLTPADREWHVRRLDGFGGSEVGALLGISPWANARTVVERKARRIIDDPDAPQRLRLRLGREMEPILLEHLRETLTERNGPTPRPRRSGLLHRMPGHPYITSDVDGFIGDALVECKTDEYGSLPWGDPDDDPARSVPPAYFAQVQHGVAAAVKKRAYTIVLIGLHEERVYEVPRRDEYIANLLEFEAGMWSRVVAIRERLADDPDASIEDLLPPLEGTELTEHLRQTYPDSTEVVRSATAEQEGWVRDLRAARRAMKEAESVYNLAAARIQDVIKDAGGLTSPEGTITWRTSKAGEKVAWELIASTYRSALLTIIEGTTEAWRASLLERAPELGIILMAESPSAGVDAVRKLFTTQTPGSRSFLVPRAWDK